MSQGPIELSSIRISHPSAGAANHEANFRVGSPEEGMSGSLDDQNASRNPEFSLPPVDGGKEAWLFLAACFVVDALIFGMKSQIINVA